MMNRCLISKRNWTAGVGMPLDMLVGEVDEDDEPTSLWVAHRRFDQCRKKCCDGDDGLAFQPSNDRRSQSRAMREPPLVG
jgi:hypothetical protein